MNYVYPAFKQSLGKGVFSLGGDTLRCALLTETYVPDAGHAVFADVAGQEITGAGYTAGGQVLSGVTWSVSGDAAVLKAADPAWEAATISARYAVLYADKTAAGVVSPLLCVLDFGGTKGVTGGSFSVAFDAAGILVLG